MLWCWVLTKAVHITVLSRMLTSVYQHVKELIAIKNIIAIWCELAVGYRTLSLVWLWL